MNCLTVGAVLAATPLNSRLKPLLRQLPEQHHFFIKGSTYRSHAPRGNASADALRRVLHSRVALICPSSHRNLAHRNDTIVPPNQYIRDAERPWLHSHAERGNDQKNNFPVGFLISILNNCTPTAIGAICPCGYSRGFDKAFHLLWRGLHMGQRMQTLIESQARNF